MINNQVITQINQTTDCGDDFSSINIPALIDHLADSDSLVRSHARDVLACIGTPAVPDLIEALHSTSSRVRWQAIKALECIQDPSVAPELVEQLRDDNAGVRWAAANALIALRRDAIPALLEALVHNFDSLWLRQGAHHILHVLKDAGKLNASEEQVLSALEDIEPAAAVPWAAEKALETRSQKK
jgi:HEAT repeat protein